MIPRPGTTDVNAGPYHPRSDVRPTLRTRAGGAKDLLAWALAAGGLLGTAVMAVGFRYSTPAQALDQERSQREALAHRVTQHDTAIALLAARQREDSVERARDRAENAEMRERVRAIYCTSVPDAVRAGCR
jgi:hypothetical protein